MGVPLYIHAPRFDGIEYKVINVIPWQKICNGYQPESERTA